MVSLEDIKLHNCVLTVLAATLTNIILYLQRKEKTREVFVNDPIKSGNEHQETKQSAYFMYSDGGKARISMTSQMPLVMNAGNSGAGTQQTRHRG